MKQAFRYAMGHAILSPKLKWRHHGIGVLQAYFHEGDNETRVHIWDPSLVLSGLNESSGLVHDHRFSFRSFVLLGAIYNEEFEFKEDVNGQWVKYGVTHARKAMEETGTFHKSLGLLDERRYLAGRCGQWFCVGEEYAMQAREFHLSKVSELTVTLVVKTGLTDGSAVIAGKYGVPLVHAFDHPNRSNDYSDLIGLAASKLIGGNQ